MALPLILGLLGFASISDAEKPPAPTRLTLVCVEQPARQVTFDGEGQVKYTEIAPEHQDPVTLTLIKIAPGEDYEIEPARIESSADWLNRTRALWSRGNQVAADNGRLRIDLVKNRLFITEAKTDGNADFRRFDCEDVATDSPDSHGSE
ncbi:hypothetical protein Thiowin_02856 [Thiorhodovibrio winogradskyi]|uniref:Uncharacterized protein n=1 Tax=Thiorhodovibrio winogradskyi TaxID=77007 RepID=A0ABZ0SBB8_9GAMM|nr:hypothetical protein [Thiorhodovibrio winogradskyi]